eukprot:7936129-Alexandrium_andersonii.AAC.1
MVYGCRPYEVVGDIEDGAMAQGSEVQLPFYKRRKVRLTTIQTFQEAVLQERLAGAMRGRARAETER